VVNAHILCNKTKKNEVAKGSLASASMEIQVQGLTSSLAGRLIGRDHSLYRNPVTHANLEANSQHLCHMCAVRSEHLTRKTMKKRTTMYCQKCDVGLCIGHHTKLN